MCITINSGQILMNCGYSKTNLLFSEQSNYNLNISSIVFIGVHCTRLKLEVGHVGKFKSLTTFY